MTIEEMRQLHQRALSDAEAKRTELRLVLASRYRELVGSSDEVIKMKERAQELHDLVHALPGLFEKVATSEQVAPKRDEEEEDEKKVGEDDIANKILVLRRQLSSLPRSIHRVLDVNDVYQGTSKLIDLFTLIASQTDCYKLANVLSKHTGEKQLQQQQYIDPALEAQMRMVFLQMQTVPDKIIRIANKNLLCAASYSEAIDGMLGIRDEKDASVPTASTATVSGAELSASALASLDLLDVQKKDEYQRAMQLLDVYFQSKAKLLMSLLDQLTVMEDNEGGANKQSVGSEKRPEGASATSNAESILSNIVLILQYDVILYPYQIFVARKFRSTQNDAEKIMNDLPQAFDQTQVKIKCSKFLAAHLPLIRTKVKTVLVSIAGTTASALGQIRQSLYDKTDGAECMDRLNNNGICTWDEAVQGVVDVRRVLSHTDGNVAAAGASGASGAASAGSSSSPIGLGGPRFSLWSALFSNTFSSLVHSLLTSAFQSVHTRVVSKLRASLANAPPLGSILPHEAYRNTLRIATELNEALLKVSDDAHELLVHAEEREESERRLRQSLYVQTCEIMGRLICELRRMVYRKEQETHNRKDATNNGDSFDATKDLIVGRLCFLLKFRLTSLPTLLDPSSSPAAMHSTTGMISYVDIQSAFELADINEDGLITFDEAMETVESAFSGTRFRGAEMVRETLLLPSSDQSSSAASSTDMAKNVTLMELTLLAARGLRHDASGYGSALGAVQYALDDIVQNCFGEWSAAATKSSTEALAVRHTEFLRTACSVADAEWQRLYPADATSPLTVSPNPVVYRVSPYVVCYFLDVSSLLNRTTCPSDSLSPVPSMAYAASLGIVADRKESILTLADNLRWALLRRSLQSISSILGSELDSLDGIDGAISALAQYHLDTSFLKNCFFERNQYGFGSRESETDSVTDMRDTLDKCLSRSDLLLREKSDRNAFQQLCSTFPEWINHVYTVSDLSFSSLLGEALAGTVSAAGVLDVGIGKSSAVALYEAPLPSSRRFVLLPVQADRSLSEIQLRNKYAKEKEATSSNRHEPVGPTVLKTGLGLFSSMLKRS